MSDADTRESLQIEIDATGGAVSVAEPERAAAEHCGAATQLCRSCRRSPRHRHPLAPAAPAAAASAAQADPKQTSSPSGHHQANTCSARKTSKRWEARPASTRSAQCCTAKPAASSRSATPAASTPRRKRRQAVAGAVRAVVGHGLAATRTSGADRPSRRASSVSGGTAARPTRPAPHAEGELGAYRAHRPRRPSEQLPPDWQIKPWMLGFAGGGAVMSRRSGPSPDRSITRL